MMPRRTLSEVALKDMSDSDVYLIIFYQLSLLLALLSATCHVPSLHTVHKVLQPQRDILSMSSDKYS